MSKVHDENELRGVEELKEVVNAVSEFLMNLKQPIKELLEMVM